MAVLWGSLGALFIGLTDLALVRVSGRASIITLMVLVSSGGVALGLVAVMFIPSTLGASGLAWGAAAGLSMGAALAIYVEAMRVTSVSVASPVVAVLNALIPFVWGVAIEGERLAGMAIVGAVIAMASLIATTWLPERASGLIKGVSLALVSGALYGVGAVFLAATDEDAGMWPAVSHRAAGVVMFLFLATVFGLPRLSPRGLRISPFAAGLFGSAAVIAILIGVQRESLSIVAVSSGTFPAFSVALLHFFAGHALRWWQAVGILGAIGGVAMIAVA